MRSSLVGWIAVLLLLLIQISRTTPSPTPSTTMVQRRVTSVRSARRTAIYRSPRSSPQRRALQDIGNTGRDNNEDNSFQGCSELDRERGALRNADRNTESSSPPYPRRESRDIADCRTVKTTYSGSIPDSGAVETSHITASGSPNASGHQSPTFFECALECAVRTKTS
ncbi:hypothetical protein B0H11DRAFT_1905791 [Mycena galericulata]|nr:hypothetical protein B0H11DRAFT_1905791 [Mycena galericulata]